MHTHRPVSGRKPGTHTHTDRHQLGLPCSAVVSSSADVSGSAVVSGDILHVVGYC